jgi:hypothetical protein
MRITGRVDCIVAFLALYAMSVSVSMPATLFRAKAGAAKWKLKAV